MTNRFRNILLFAIILFAQNVHAQWEPSWNLGISVGGVVGINESVQQSLNPQFNVNALWLNGIAPHWSAEFDAGSGKISSPNQGGFSEYSTNIIPIDFRVRFTPFDNPDWQPYIYAGIGFLSYSVNSAPPNSSQDAKLNGTAIFLPLGIGLYHPIDKNWSVEASIGENPTFSDDLNPVHDNRNDAYWGFRIGISYCFGDRNTHDVDEYDFGPRGTSQILNGVMFDSGTAKMRIESEKVLTKVLEALNNHSEIEIEFRSYMDTSLDFNTSMAVTHDRAEALKVWFVSRGISASRISTLGYGPHNPLVQNTSEENMQKNRRIEIVRMK